MSGKLTKFGWYWHRLHAMSAGEIALRLQKKKHQFSDARFQPGRQIDFEPNSRFPVLPEKARAPLELIAGLREDVEKILSGDWKAFGHLPLKVDDPPRWHADNLVGKDLQSSRVAFKLDHRAQPAGADIKVIWEPNRWYQLVRLAMGAWLLDDASAQEKCIEWLHDWVRQNPPFTGLNWTSGLETGIRLIQFAWIDSFLVAAKAPHKSLLELRRQILEPHMWYTWRYKSFGSSANNHLLGELAGLIVALARWPDLEKVSASLPVVGGQLEREVLAQFASDGGNNEQALGYHLFSWEFCWQSVCALEAAGCAVSETATERLKNAADFYCAIKPEGDPWDFGDSDNAWVTPLFGREENCAAEWWRWFHDSVRSPALRFWWGDFRRANPVAGWRLFQESGYAVFEQGDWFLRVDFSALGYLSMAPHGHLDALHLSLWYRGNPVVIDPGTGCYYHDKRVRNYLAGWTAHNSPQIRHAPGEYPKRFGTFLWGPPHGRPLARLEGDELITEFQLPWGTARRAVACLKDSNSIRIRDSFSGAPGGGLVTRWKLAPGIQVGPETGGVIRVGTPGGSLRLRPGPGWTMNRSWNPPPELASRRAVEFSGLGNVPLEAVVAPAFRCLAPAAWVVLESDMPGPLDLTITPE